MKDQETENALHEALDSALATMHEAVNAAFEPPKDDAPEWTVEPSSHYRECYKVVGPWRHKHEFPLNHCDGLSAADAARITNALNSHQAMREVCEALRKAWPDIANGYLVTTITDVCKAIDMSKHYNEKGERVVRDG